MRFAARLGLGLSGAVGLILAGCAAPSFEPQQAIVVSHVDAGTFDADVDGSTKRIRLLNIDTPKTTDPTLPAQCLGPEASQFLASLLPIGTLVRLEFDKKREDQEGRTLAAAFTADGKLANAEVARAGFAQVAAPDENVRFRPPVEQAVQEAADNKRGLHSAEVQCTWPARVAVVSDSVTQTPTLATQPPNADSTALYAAVNLAYLSANSARSLLYDLDHATNDFAWTVLTLAERTNLRAQTQAAVDTLISGHITLQNAAIAAKAREDLAAQKAAQAEADRVAREQAAAQEAEQRRAAAEAQRQQAAEQRAAEAPGRSSGGGRGGGGRSGHPCGPGERDGDGDGYCGEGR